jgi:tryptophan halogenase
MRELPAARVDWTSLPCDRLLSGFAPGTADAPALTQTIATEQGWMWRLPVGNRAAVGYVYRGDLLSDDAAREVWQVAAGSLDQPEVHGLRAGRRVHPWTGNCIALGAAAIELEPLVGADLHAAQLGISALIELFPVADPSAIEAAEYNRIMADYADGLRDFTLAHYHVGAPRRGELCRATRDMPLPERLANKLELFRANGRIELLDLESFEETDWAWLLLGSQHFPRALELQSRELVSKVPREHVAGILEQVMRLATSMPTHMDFVRHQRAQSPRVPH